MPVMTRSQKKKMEMMDNMTHPQLVRMKDENEELMERLYEEQQQHYLCYFQINNLKQEKEDMKKQMDYAYQQINSLTNKKHMLKEENEKLEKTIVAQTEYLKENEELKKENEELKEKLKKENEFSVLMTKALTKSLRVNEKLKEDILEMGAEINKRCAGELMFHQTPDGENCLIEIG